MTDYLKGATIRPENRPQSEAVIATAIESRERLRVLLAENYNALIEPYRFSLRRFANARGRQYLIPFGMEAANKMHGAGFEPPAIAAALSAMLDVFDEFELVKASN